MASRGVSVRLVVDTSALIRAGRQAQRSLHGFSVGLMRPAVRRRHRRRCVTCRPFANPRPLTIDGHAYHRRTRARRRRR